MEERRGFSGSGPMMAGVLLAAQVGVIALLVAGVSASVLTVVFQIGVLVALTGFTLVAPNQSKVVTLFGRYLGTVRQNGLRWTCPFTKREQVSLRVRNFDSDTLKVNDAMGNPIEVAAVVVWRVVDTAKAVFDVEDYENFVEIQTETAVRHMASAYPYDTYERGQVSLQSNAEQVMATLHAELQVHLAQAGVEVLRTQLRRQQAEAVVAARQRIVEGAVGMVDHALELLSAREIVALDEERKAAMVSNLLVVLCSESRTQPVVNTGTLYQ